MVTTIRDLPTPLLLLDLDVLEANLQRMATRARELGVALRPHLKTHKCVEIAERQRALGASGVTVSTLYEARVFADHGFDDITWALPVPPGRLVEARELAERVTLRLVVDTPEAVAALQRAHFPFHVWLKVDCGYHRAGVDPGSELAVDLAREIHQSPTLSFDGILSHSGHAYQARGREALANVAEEERRVMVACANRLRERGIDVSRVSVGSTPAMSAARVLDDVTEVRPGNYVFHDYSQTVIGSCGVRDCAVTVLATVVSSQPGAEHCVVDAGALALSKDPGPSDGSCLSMGEIFDRYEDGTLRSDARVVSLSQEHGLVRGRLPAGERVRILPNHSCLTVACFDEYHLVRGERVLGRWKIWRGRG
jgi:D-serine deaminase-like pyridoxal phosphate-dependent protein